MNKHFLDKPILRDFFWFIVLPYKLKQFVAERNKKMAAFERITQCESLVTAKAIANSALNK